jgi:rhodanese-related sulfurtransferase
VSREGRGGIRLPALQEVSMVWSRMLALLLLSLTPACDRTPAEPAATGESFGKLSLDEVARLIASGTAVVFDVNGRDRYAKGHLPGARWAAFDDVKPSDLPAGRDQPLIFYCANELCSASHDAARQAVTLGYTHVFVMPAGIYGWEKAGKPTESIREAPP